MALEIIATVESISGKAFARNADGELRALSQGGTLKEGETLVTPAGSNVELVLADGSPLQVDDVAEIAMTADLIPADAAGPEESAAEEGTVQAILAALEEGQDLSEAFEPTGASGESPANEGHDYIRLARILEETEEFEGVTGSDAAEQIPPLTEESLIPVDANDDMATTDQGESIIIDVQSNDSFLEGAEITAVTQGENGSVIVNPDNTVTYIPDDDFYGTDTFTYTSTSVDGNGQDTAQVTVEVIPPPNPVATISINPIGGDDVIDIDEAGNATITVSGSVGGDARSGDEINIEFGDGTTYTTSVGDDLSFSIAADVSTVLTNEFVAGNVSGEDEFGNSYEAEADRSYDIEIPQKITAISNESEVEGDDLVFEVTLHPLSFYADQGIHTFEIADVTTSAGDYGAITFSNDVVNNNDGTITVPAGLTSFTVTVAGVDDNISEPDETFTIAIDGVSGATGTGEILDDDGTPTLSISDAGNVTEGGLATFTVTLSNPSSQTVTVQFATQDGTARVVDGDYIANSNTITFLPGETSKQIQVQTIDDNVSELDEQFTVALSNPSNATISDDSGAATIKDTDGGPTLSISDAGNVTEGGLATFTVTLSNPSSQTVTVQFATQDGTARVVDGDYIANSNTITFLPGETSKQIQVQTSDDNVSELDEQFTVALSNPSNATISDDSGAATIKDTDGTPTLSISDAGNVTEGGLATFTVTLSNPSSQTVTVQFATQDGTARVVDGDYIANSNTITFLPGETSKQIQVQTSDDNVSELDEQFTVALSNPSNATISDDSGAATIKDTDGTPTLSISDAGNVTEGGLATFTVSLSNPSSQTVTVQFATQDGTARVVDGDYIANSNTITFLPGETSKQIQVQTIDDNVSELDEQFTVALSNPSNATISDDSGAATIKDTDGTPTLSIADAGNVTEGGLATFTVTLSNPSSQTVTVQFATQDGTARVVDGDYIANSNTITFLPGETSKQIQVQTSDDNVSELDEQFTVALSNPSNATISDDSGAATIKDTDGTPTLSISDAGNVTEGGLATFTVTLSNPSSQTVTVQFATQDGTARVVDGDYIANSNTITFLPGETSKQIQVQTSDDNVSELDEQFTVALSNPSNATISDDSGAATIKDTDGTPTLSISDAGNVTEGGLATFTVTLSNPSSQTVTVQFATQDGTARVVDGDYIANSNTITFLPGETSKQIQVQTIDDNVSELDEQFTVALSNPSNATISDDSGAATIKDTDGTPTLSIADAGNVTEGGLATFTVTLSNPSSQTVTVQFATQDGTARVVDGDYIANSNTITFLPGETSKQIQVQTSDDNVSELDEQFTVALSNPSNATISDDSGAATIKDTDGTPTLSIADAGNVTEGGLATFTVTLSNPSSQTVTVQFATQDGTARVVDGDYIANSNTITFLPGETSKQIQVQTSDDNVSELDEQFTVALSNPSNATISDDSGAATIKDTDGTPTLSISDAGNVTEGGLATFTVTLSNPSSQTVTVQFATQDGTARVVDGDYIANSNTITFLPGETSKQIQVQTIDDNVSELDEQFTVALSNPSNATISDDSGAATIKDTDGTPTLSIADAGNVTEGGLATFTVTLSNPSSQTVTVQFATQDGTARVVDGDYIANSNTITFLPGETSKQIQVQTSDDNVSELDEQFTVALSNPSNATISDDSGAATIKDTDGTPTLSIADAGNVTEGGLATFTVTLSNPSSQTVTVQFATQDGTARVVDGDYIANSNTITFLPGETSKQIQVQTSDDNVSELDEQFTVALSNPSNATISDDSGAATIKDTDGTPTLSISDAGNVTEGGLATFTVTLSNPSSQTVTVQFATQDGTARVVDGDYIANSNTITFLPGETSKQIQVQTIDDSDFEPLTEQFVVQLSNPTNATIADNSGTAGILDNDADDPVLISDPNQAQVDESDMPDGNPGSPGFPVTTGTFSITTADGFGSMTITGQNGNVNFANMGALLAAIGSGVIGTGTVYNIGEHGTLELYASVGTPETGMTVNYAYTLTSAEDHLTAASDPITMGADDGWDVFNLSVTDAGNGVDNSATATIEIEIIDDEPVLHDPESVLLVDGSDVEGVPINFNFADVAGADGVGSINFNGVVDGAVALDIYGNTLSLDSDRLYTFVSDDGATLWVATADPEVGAADIAFTVEIIGDTYTVRSNDSKVFNGTELATADLTTVGGGNENPKVMVDPFGEFSDTDILVTGAGGSGRSNDNSVNSNNGQLGVGTGQDIDYDSGDPAGDSLRLEFGNLASGQTSINNDERTTINRMILPIESASNGSVNIELFFHDPDNGFAQTATTFTIWDATGTTQLTYPDDLQGLNGDSVVMIIGDQNFDTIEISHGTDQGDGSFKLGEFALTEFADGEPIHLSYGIQAVDGDGDPVPGDASSTEINFTLLSEPDNVVTAGSTDDVLLATDANDLFVWELADAGTPGAPSDDQIIGFGAGGSDVLDIRDLLQLEDNGGVDSIGNLLEYLHVTEVGGDTVLHISSAGGFSGGVYDAGAVDQTISLQGVDLVGAGTMTEIIQDMLSTGKLITD